jgi:murein L,D-transpeptidase YcbB/YkuD
MNSSKEKWVALDKTVGVFITYFTSWVDEDGVLHFVDDVYGHY